jgi:NADH dehydrogenase
MEEADMRHLVILGGGFAGVWAALGAVKAQGRHGPGATEVRVTLVSRDRWLTIRPRLHEASLDDVRVPLDDVLGPVGVERVEAEITRIDAAARAVAVAGAAGARVLRYDRLVLAAGSHVHRPPIPGAERAFTVDTYAEAVALQRHLAALPTAEIPGDARFTAVVVGAGFTGVEVATALVTRLRAIGGAGARVVLVGAASAVAPDLGPGAREEVERALDALGIETRAGRPVAAIDRGGVTLAGGERIPAATAVWTGGFRASRLAEQLPVERDAQGRLPVDAQLRVRGVEGVYAAGDVARAMADPTHVAAMSCQHAIPMGERAGANAAADLLGAPAAPFAPPPYVTCLDLGDAGALFMEGWDREVRLAGFWGKLMKETINTRLIYPPRAVREEARAAATGARSAA